MARHVLLCVEQEVEQIAHMFCLAVVQEDRIYLP